MKKLPTVAIGMFTHNEEQYVREAVDSLLAQTYSDFRLILIDDFSSDSTSEILQQYAVDDSRVSYQRNESRRGYAANYRTTFDLAGPEVDFFAWAAGHDRHHPEWLSQMLKALDENPGAVVAYPETVRISETGERMPVPSPLFDTSGLLPGERITALRRDGAGFGNMIYGLFRADAIRKAGVFPRRLLPDTMLFWHMSLNGTFVQVREELWFRRFKSSMDIQRQKRIAFAPAPWYIHLPWPILNSISLGWSLALRPRAGGLSKRLLGMKLAIAFFFKFVPTMERDYPLMGKLVLFPIRVKNGIRTALRRGK